MEKLVVRYFYCPICPESFATLERLQKLFKEYEDRIHFETFNITEGDFKSDYPWSPIEKKIIRYQKPLLYGKLFVDGVEIRGFPPSAKLLKELFDELDLEWQSDLYSFDYKKVDRDAYDCSEGFKIDKYDETNLTDVCLVCTRHHPYIKPGSYSKERWEVPENKKERFLAEHLNNETLIGYIAYLNNQPVGFVEGFPLEIAEKLGFPIDETDGKGLMITCLTLRKEVKGNGLAKELLQIFEREARDNYTSIQVLSFPDEHNWQPQSIYQKLGYGEVRKIDGLSLMKKELSSYK